MRNSEHRDGPRQEPSGDGADKAEIERRVAAIRPSLDGRQRMAAIIEADPSLDADMLLIAFYRSGDLPAEEEIAFERRVWTDGVFRDRVDFVEWMLSLVPDDEAEHPKPRRADRRRRGPVDGVERRTFTHAEIAAQVNLPIATVGWHLCKGFEELEHVMKLYNSGEELPANIKAELLKRRNR